MSDLVTRVPTLCKIHQIPITTTDKLKFLTQPKRFQMMECLRCGKQKKNNKETEVDVEDGRSLKDEIRELFRLFDTNNDRTMSLTELGRAMGLMGMCPTEEELEDIMRNLDLNGNGTIDFQEFFAFMQDELAKIDQPGYTQREDVLRSAFKAFDKDGSGFIEADEFRVAMKKFGDSLEDKEIDDMMRLADANEDGMIDYEEFVRMWSMGL